MPSGPLHRNRDFLLLQVAQLLSSGGSQLTGIAYPLLVLALTGSAAQAGLVGFARLLPMALFALPAGLAADRWSRRRVMIGAHAVRAVAVGSLGAIVFLDQVELWMILLVAFVEGGGAAYFAAAQSGALRAVVPRPQLPAAVSTVTGREAVVILVSPPLGGALFAIARGLPFAVHALSYAASTVALLAIRTPFEDRRTADPEPARRRLAEGWHFLWTNPFQRTTAFLFGLANFVGPGVLFAIVVIAEDEGLSGGRIGVLVALFGAGVLVGSLLSPFVRRLLPVRGVIVLELWTWVGCAAFVIWPSVYVLAASIVPTALAIPATDSVVRSLQLATTPDRILGRVESARMTIALFAAPLGPLVAGILLERTSDRLAIALFALVGLALASWGTLSSAIRRAPSLAELHRPPGTAPVA